MLLCAWGIYGSATHYPLRWSEAYFSKDKNVNSLSLNPVLFFFSSFTSADTSVDMESFGRYLPSMTRYLGTTEEAPFDRVSEGKAGPRPNIVFVMLESFGAAPMSVFGNPDELYSLYGFAFEEMPFLQQCLRAALGDCIHRIRFDYGHT